MEIINCFALHSANNCADASDEMLMYSFGDDVRLLLLKALYLLNIFEP